MDGLSVKTVIRDGNYLFWRLSKTEPCVHAKNAILNHHHRQLKCSTGFMLLLNTDYQCMYFLIRLLTVKISNVKSDISKLSWNINQEIGHDKVR
jgi:hypothetical protein